jgi:hypothetical protein
LHFLALQNDKDDWFQLIINSIKAKGPNASASFAKKTSKWGDPAAQKQLAATQPQVELHHQSAAREAETLMSLEERRKALVSALATSSAPAGHSFTCSLSFHSSFSSNSFTQHSLSLILTLL